jgi:catechol 2,3-dioxygenase-like lactoylglutathione lyase family enzyme
MFSHVTVGTTDLARAKAFYSAVLEPLALVCLHDDDRYVGFGRGLTADGRPVRPMFWVCLPYDGGLASAGNGQHVAFVADDRAVVDQVHALALAGGGTDEGAPGLREHYHPSYYGAYFRDLDGNKLQVCCHGERS